MAEIATTPFPPLTRATNKQMVKRLYLIRHGETAANASNVLQGRGIDLNLNERGMDQAKRLGKRFEGEQIDVFLASNLVRAIETCNQIRKDSDSVMYTSPDVAEISWGTWEGTDNMAGVEALRNAWDEGDLMARAPQGESPLECEFRAVPFLLELITSRPETYFCVVLHGRLLRIILASLLFNDVRAASSFHHHNTCVNVIDVIMEPLGKTLEKPGLLAKEFEQQFEGKDWSIKDLGRDLPTRVVTRKLSSSIFPSLPHTPQLDSDSEDVEPPVSSLHHNRVRIKDGDVSGTRSREWGVDKLEKTGFISTPIQWTVGMGPTLPEPYQGKPLREVVESGQQYSLRFHPVLLDNIAHLSQAKQDKIG